MDKVALPAEVRGIFAKEDWVIHPMLEKLLGALGYDIEIQLVKRRESGARNYVKKDTVSASNGFQHENRRCIKQYLYLLTFPNGMVYVGITYNLNNRWVSNGLAYKGQVVWDAICEFGWENVKKEVLMYIPAAEDGTAKIRAKELELIQHYGDRCYNRTGTDSFRKELQKKKNPTTITYAGVTKTYLEWAKEPGVTVTGPAIARRIKNGWTVHDALFSPAIKHGPGQSMRERSELCASYRNKSEQEETP